MIVITTKNQIYQEPQIMLISFTYKKHPLYNSLFKEKNVIYSCLPITYKRCSYLLTLFDNLEGVLLDEEIVVSIYVNKKRKIVKTIEIS